MSIFVRGRDVTEDVLNAPDSTEIAILFEELSDEYPRANETTAVWQQRRDDLLSAMLAQHSNPDSEQSDLYY